MLAIACTLLLFCLHIAAVHTFDHVSREEGLPLTYRTAVHGLIPWQYLNFHGGQLAPIAQHPWTATLQLYGRHRCSAALISSRKMLSSATCTHQISARSLVVRLGTDDTRTGGRVHFVQNIYEHSEYNGTSLENDISVLVLRDAVDLSSAAQVATIALPATEDTTTEVDEMVGWSGWEVCEGCGVHANLLKSGAIRVMGREKCDAYYRGGVSRGMMCGATRALREGEVLEAHEVCQRDAGGPVVEANQDGANVLVAIVVWGHGCDRSIRPGVYTLVAPHLKWINSIEV